MYAGSGNQEEVKKLIDILNMPKKQIGVFFSWSTPHYLKIELFRLQGDIEKAIIEYDNLGWLFVLNLELKARVFSAAGDWEKVISTTQEMQSSRFFYIVSLDTRFHDYPRAFYYRGIADEEIPKRRDTIKRLAALKQGS